MEPLEHAEELVGVFHIEAGPVVANEKNGLAVSRYVSDLHHGWVAAAAVFNGVPQQTGPHLLEQSTVALARRQFAELHLDSPSLALDVQFPQGVAHQFGRVYARLIQRLPAPSRERTQIVD